MLENENKPRILVVDDEGNIREMLARHFRFIGYDVLTASQGREALQILETERGLCLQMIVLQVNMLKPTMLFLDQTVSIHL